MVSLTEEGWDLSVKLLRSAQHHGCISLLAARAVLSPGILWLTTTEKVARSTLCAPSGNLISVTLSSALPFHLTALQMFHRERNNNKKTNEFWSSLDYDQLGMRTLLVLHTEQHAWWLLPALPGFGIIVYGRTGILWIVSGLLLTRFAEVTYDPFAGSGTSHGVRLLHGSWFRKTDDLALTCWCAWAFWSKSLSPWCSRWTVLPLYFIPLSLKCCLSRVLRHI